MRSSRIYVAAVAGIALAMSVQGDRPIDGAQGRRTCAPAPVCAPAPICPAVVGVPPAAPLVPVQPAPGGPAGLVCPPSAAAVAPFPPRPILVERALQIPPPPAAKPPVAGPPRPSLPPGVAAPPRAALPPVAAAPLRAQTPATASGSGCLPAACCCEDAKVCISARESTACYNENGVRAFASLMREAAATGIENAAARGFGGIKTTQHCKPCPPAKP